MYNGIDWLPNTKGVFIMDYESIKRLGLEHYNIDLEKSFETFDPSNNNHTIVLYLKKDKTINCPYCF